MCRLGKNITICLKQVQIMDDEDAVLAAKAAVDSILACEVSDSRQITLHSAFRSILSFRSVFDQLIMANAEIYFWSQILT